MKIKITTKIILLVLTLATIIAGIIVLVVFLNRETEIPTEDFSTPEHIESTTEEGSSEELIVPPIIPNDSVHNPSSTSPDIDVDVDDYVPNLSPTVKDVDITYDTKEETQNEKENN